MGLFGHLISAIGDVASRTFEDSAGILWEVFEVHRTSEVLRGVSAGLEKGWLAFVSANGKRRLAPFPTEWESVPETELERLCAVAHVANPAHYPLQVLRGPGENTSSSFADKAGRAQKPEPEPATKMEQAEESLVREVVRVFAQEARTNKLPAIEAMVRLKALLLERYGGDDVEPATRADATDMRSVRRWFVEAFYFERPV